MTKRDAICETALELFAEKGIEATTTREIAERAGTAEGTLYRHFDGKADLAQWLYRRCVDQLHETLVQAAEGLPNPMSRLKAMIRGVFDFYATKPASCRYLLSTRESGVVGGPDDETRPSPIRLFVDVLDDGMQKGVFRDVPSPLVAGWILAMVRRTVLFMKADAPPLAEQEAIDRTVDASRRLVKEASS